ncbi:MAG: galactose-1-phosphate uridylyltransferase [Pseudomonadota bacterium]|nr:galactose-1-phosphate uridylyltransferase [Pseudomonadota bacterium]
MIDHLLREDMAMPDGRVMYLYGPWRGGPSWTQHPEPRSESKTHARWHPLRKEWVIYAAQRQNRTYKPALAACPLCPGSADGELPFDDFTLAVFENRFPSMQPSNHSAPDLSTLGLLTRPAKGACEVIVYSSRHEGNIATIPEANRELLVRVWGDRRQVLLGKPGVSYVMPFENRGEEAGVTLHHPHGQIYGFEDLPPTVDTMAASFKAGFNLQEMLPCYMDLTIFETDDIASFVPPFARFPYEVWLTTKRFHASTDRFSASEIQDVAEGLRYIVDLYDRFFDRACPYVMIVYLAPREHVTTFPFHIQFYPLLRAKTRQKFLAGCELGAGTFLVDVLPEEAAAQLRAAGGGSR